MWNNILKVVVIFLAIFAAAILLMGSFAIIELWLDYKYPENNIDIMDSAKNLVKWLVLVLLSIIYLRIPKVRKICISFLKL
jgi:hypothetical protein